MIQIQFEESFCHKRAKFENEKPNFESEGWVTSNFVRRVKAVKIEGDEMRSKRLTTNIYWKQNYQENVAFVELDVI